MGLLSSIAIGLGEGAKAAQPYIANMQQAEIQQLRDDRMAELQRKFETEVRQPFQTSERQAGQEFTKGMETDVRQPYQTGERVAGETFKSGESAKDRTLREKEIAQQGSRIGLEERKVKLAEDAGALDLKVKQSIDDARQSYVNETDPEKRQQAGATYLTLLGKVGERYKELSSTNAAGDKVTTGFFDTLSGKEIQRPSAAPYSDGTKLRGKDGRDYVVQGGVPVPASAGQAQKPLAPPAPEPANVPTGSPSDAEFNGMLADAQRGGQTGLNYIQDKLQSGGLNIRQRQAANSVLPAK